MYDNKSQCGPNAIDEYDNRTEYHSNGGRYKSTTHKITGTGIITGISSPNWNNIHDDFQVYAGITELGDHCFSKQCVRTITLPNTLVRIGSSCFASSKIENISLPDSLEEMGHNNFPSTLTSLSLPAKLATFYADNISRCYNLTSIGVSAQNTAFRSIDGILYNYDVTEAIVCPRGKVGKVIIPETVKRIGDNCFQLCTQLTSIELPRKLESIGALAFSGLKLDQLVIHNSVTTIGDGCFLNTTIAKNLRLPAQIQVLPANCFEGANIPKINSLQRITSIGDYCFKTKFSGFVPPSIIFENLQHIGVGAFMNNFILQTIELASTLKQIGDNAFYGTGNLKLICLSAVPCKVSNNAFCGVNESGILYVPKGSKVIYENTQPWSSFSSIEEFDLCQDIENGGDVSDEHMFFRLNSVANSFRTADRYQLAELIKDIALSYQYVDNDDDYKAALEIIKFNRMFNPVLIPNFEKELCADWKHKYKLACASTCIFDICSAPISTFSQNGEIGFEQNIVEQLPMLENFQIEGPTSASIDLEEIDVHCSDILRHLQNEISVAQTSIKIAVSWFTNYALFKQIKELAQNGIDVQLVINNDSVNNDGYCLDFNELIEAGVKISLVEYPHLLHHKFCIIDDRIVINGSYNWTRFSGNNYENIMIIRNNDEVCNSFSEEFGRMQQLAEHKNVDKMPEAVPQRPEYDRYAFKQYITEELDAEARETSEHRDKITALQKASELNPEYFEKLNPKAKEELSEAMKVVEQSVTVTKNIVSMVEKTPISSSSQTSQQTSTTTSSSASKSNNPVACSQVVTKSDIQTLEQIKAADLFMVLDVSGSMKEVYMNGHAYGITTKALSAALVMAESQEVSLWTFNDEANYVANIGLGNISQIHNVAYTNSGTNLKKFVDKANTSIKTNSLVIIFTDDDGRSIKGAVSRMQARSDVFWQIIVYGEHENISSTIAGIPNLSLVCMHDYSSKEDDEISHILLKDYISWKTSK